jgi:hypothetical protein
LPHVISERKKVTGTIGTLILENNALPITIIIIIIIIIIIECRKLKSMALECLPVA